MPMIPIALVASSLSLLLSGSVRAVPAADESGATLDPAQQEVALPTPHPDWNASLVVDQGETGIWTVKPIQFFDEYGATELVGCDDDGRLLVMVGYSGKWTPLRIVEERAWLGGLTHGDVDPRIDGAEMYTGGKRGYLHAIVPHGHGHMDDRIIAHFPGCEIHTILAGDLDPRSEGAELLVFTRPGALYRVAPTGEHGTFETELLEELTGRVRDAVVLDALPAREGRGSTIATVSRDGRLELVSIGPDGVEHELVHAETVGSGRLTLAPDSTADRPVLYQGLDDGRVLRHERAESGAWDTTTIFIGPQGVRGVAAGRFFADPRVESLAVFGYGAHVHLLHRERAPGRDGEWQVETIFVDRDKGHWLSAAEVDGRNATQEIVGSGYGGRIFLLSRPPGYGLDGAVTAPPVEEADANEATSDDERGAEDAASSKNAAFRLAVRAGAVADERLTPLDYGGGFESKTLVYDTLVRRSWRGGFEPGLATSWVALEDGARWRFEVDTSRTFHDGTPVTAEAVAQHMERWMRLPEHGWLVGCSKIEHCRVLDHATLELELSEPWNLLPELCAINPCSVGAPACFDRTGRFAAPVGSGPYRFEGAEGGVLAYRRVRGDGPRELELVRFDEGSEATPLEALIAGEVDAIVDGWFEVVPRPLPELPDDVVVQSSRGSRVVQLSFEARRGATRELDVRRRVADAIDRRALVDTVEGGHGEPCSTLFDPRFGDWPMRGTRAREASLVRFEAPPSPPPAPLVLLVPNGDARIHGIATAVRDQCLAAGVAVAIERATSDEEFAARLEAGDWDLRIERSWGRPYDPDLTLASRFLDADDAGTAVTPAERAFGPDLAAGVAEYVRETWPARRAQLRSKIQAAVETELPCVPLYVPDRLALRRASVPELVFGVDGYRAALPR